MNTSGKLWVVAVHPKGPLCEMPLDDLLEFNRARLGHQEITGYWPLETAGTVEEAQGKAREWKKRRREEGGNLKAE